jgi:hypothetical protein
MWLHGQVVADPAARGKVRFAALTDRGSPHPVRRAALSPGRKCREDPVTGEALAGVTLLSRGVNRSATAQTLIIVFKAKDLSGTKVTAPKYSSAQRRGAFNGRQSKGAGSAALFPAVL